jgi:hypothetical protein
MREFFMVSAEDVFKHLENLGGFRSKKQDEN